MYKRNSQGWLTHFDFIIHGGLKHFDFILIDELCLQFSMILAAFIRLDIFLYSSVQYISLAFVAFLIDALVACVAGTMDRVLRRTNLREITETLIHCCLVFALITAYLFMVQSAETYSRIFLVLTFFLHIITGCATRFLWKKIVRSHKLYSLNKGKIFLILQPDTADAIMEKFLKNTIEGFKIAGAALTEKTDRKEILGVPVVTDIDHVSAYICQEWIDAVFIDCPTTNTKLTKIMDDCRQMALPVFYHVPFIGLPDTKQFVENIGGITVLTTTINYTTPSQLFIKRCIDIIGGIIGSIIALIMIAIFGPIIKKQSPGPILFKQERIGENGKRFKMIKIRSMYLDAEKRKKELAEQNRVKDGRMFKIDFDPRIIGNEILPDGTHKTGIGEFIRRYSFDEFPQFFNVLMGQMSLVGTRPPTVDEWEKYEFHHRARLACKPGITGMWQVSGRSEITDFEEIVKLDTQYITNWSFWLDIKILFKTVLVVLTHRGAM